MTIFVEVKSEIFLIPLNNKKNILLYNIVKLWNIHSIIVADFIQKSFTVWI